MGKKYGIYWEESKQNQTLADKCDSCDLHLFHELGKIVKHTQPKTNIPKSKFRIYQWIGKNYSKKLCKGKNSSFSVENKMMLHFKLNINDWDIPFPKILKIYQWIGKSKFPLGKMEWTDLEFRPYHRAIVQKALRVYIFLACMYKSIALVNKLKKLKC